jgi:hypothetical protein
MSDKKTVVVLPGVAMTKPLTVIMRRDDGPEQADAAVRALADDAIAATLVDGASEAFFGQLRIHVARDASLADKIAVYYESHGEYRSVDLADEHGENWPEGFLAQGWEQYDELRAARLSEGTTNA